MADGGRRLPKWQPTANAVPNYAVANAMPQKKYYFEDFFYLLFKVRSV